jgi:hypothetical protein
MKTFFLSILFVLLVLVVEAPPEIKTFRLAPVTIEAKSYDREIFDIALEFGADSLTARILVAQARFESGGYTNRLTIRHNNVFSMQHPRQRTTTSLGALATAEGRPNTYASYNTIRDSVADLFLYFKAKNIPITQPSITRYVNTLKKKSFFEAPVDRYRKGVFKQYNSLNV